MLLSMFLLTSDGCEVKQRLADDGGSPRPSELILQELFSAVAYL